MSRPWQMAACAVVLSASGFAAGASAPKPAPAPSYRQVTRLPSLRGAVHPLADGRVELYYDWSTGAQLADWRVVAGEAPLTRKGALLLTGRETNTLRHVAEFIGSVEAAATCRTIEELGPNGHASVALHAGPWRGYWLNLRGDGPEVYREDARAAVLAFAPARLRVGTAHTCHFARSGNLLRAWLDETVRLRAYDAAYHQGAVLLRAWRVRAGFAPMWLLGRFAPKWLAANPAVARQLDALRLYHAGVDVLRPLLAQGKYAEALAKAKALAGGQPIAASPAAKWLVADAAALEGLVQATAAAAAALKPGEKLRVDGAEATFQRFERGLLILEREGVTTSRRPLALRDDELLALLARAEPGAAARHRFGLLLLRLADGRSHTAATISETVAEAEAGDPARLLGLAIPRPRTAEKLLAVQQVTGKRLAFTGEPVFFEAEGASAMMGELRIGSDAAASGGRFVWEPRAEGQDQYGKPSSRLVFRIFVEEPRTAYLWARVRATTSNSNSWFLGLAPEGTDSPPLRPWHLAPQPGWHWQPYSRRSAVDRGSSTPSPIQLQPGVNVLVLAVRERATGLDRLYLSPSPEPPEQ